MKLPRIELGLIVFLLLILLTFVLLYYTGIQYLVFALLIGSVILFHDPREKKEQKEDQNTQPSLPISLPGAAAVWHEENITIGQLSIPYKETGSIILKNCTVVNFDIGSATLETLVIDNCIIEEFNGHFAYIEGGCTITNSVFKEVFSLTDFGHNKAEAKFENNEFFCFADFFDEVFEARFIFKNNILHQGSNLLAYEGKCYKTDLGIDPHIEGNVGDLYYEG